MAQTDPNQQLTEAVFFWQYPEYEKYQKNVWWYLLSLLVLALLLVWTILDQNYLFAVFLVLFYLMILIYDFRAPASIDFAITADGLKVGRSFYFYKEIRDFFILYQDQGIKRLYFNFKSIFRGRLVVPLDGQDPVVIREFLRQYLAEDLEQEVEPISERLRRWFKF